MTFSLKANRLWKEKIWNATPTFFINGKIVVGDIPQEQIEELINEELKK